MANGVRVSAPLSVEAAGHLKHKSQSTTVREIDTTRVSRTQLSLGMNTGAKSTRWDESNVINLEWTANRKTCINESL